MRVIFVHSRASADGSEEEGARPWDGIMGTAVSRSPTNGSCGGRYLCTAGTGYDGPTGLGTPNGTGAF